MPGLWWDRVGAGSMGHQDAVLLFLFNLNFNYCQPLSQFQQAAIGLRRELIFRLVVNARILDPICRRMLASVVRSVRAIMVGLETVLPGRRSVAVGCRRKVTVVSVIASGMPTSRL
jgi:hypothetical protein